MRGVQLMPPMTRISEDPRGLKRRMAAAGVNQADAAHALGWDQSKVSRYVNGNFKRISATDAEAFEGWLRSAEKSAGVKSTASGFQTLESGLDLPPREPAQIPIYGLAGAGNGALHLDHAAVLGFVERIGKQGPRTDAFAVQVFGSSMEPRYFPGEIVYCVRGLHPRRGDDVVIELKNGDAYLKTYEATRDGMVFVSQYNHEAIGDDTPMHWPATEIKALHAVVGRG
tara:strand:+ start:791 stop:1471 length:681 start_codon:yes stop_codon:yes gene_type:complete